MKSIKVNAKNRFKIEKALDAVQKKCKVRLTNYEEIENAIYQIYEIAPCKKSLSGVVIKLCAGAFTKPHTYKYPAMSTIVILRFDGKGGATVTDIARDYVTSNIITIESIPDISCFKEYLYNGFIRNISDITYLSNDVDIPYYQKCTGLSDIYEMLPDDDYHKITVNVGCTDYSGYINFVSDYSGKFSGLKLQFYPYTTIRIHCIPDYITVPDYYKHVGAVKGCNLFAYIPDYSMSSTTGIYTDSKLCTFDFYRAGVSGLLCKVSKIKEK